MHTPAPHDEEQVARLLERFFAAFTSGPDLVVRLEGLRELFLPSAIVVRTCGGEPTVYDVEGFLAPRKALLTAGAVREFREWQLEGRTDVFGDVAQHVCCYAKSWVEDGVAAEGRGVKSVQLVRTGQGWRISALAWDDERPGLSLGPR